MIMARDEGLVYNLKMSTVGPGHVTRADTIFELGEMDIAMKLHYLKGVYYFESSAFEGLTTQGLKEHMFTWLNHFPAASGRLFRRPNDNNESGGRRPYYNIKCSDAGVRFVEANCHKTLQEWLHLHIIKDDADLENLLVSNQCITHDQLLYSPLVYIQFTKFKCGGMCVGLSWSHVLGDLFCASEFINALGRTVTTGRDDYEYDHPTNIPFTTTNKADQKTSDVIISHVEVEDEDYYYSLSGLKRVGPIGDKWVHVPKCQMKSFSFTISPTKLTLLHSKLQYACGNDQSTTFTPFQILTSLIWQCIAKTRQGGHQLVTICEKKKTKLNSSINRRQSQVALSVVKADFPIEEASLSDVASLLVIKESSNRIEEALERSSTDNDNDPDFIAYGANLTFVNLEEADLYDFEYRGHKPVCVSYGIDGVGEQGAILVSIGPDGAERTVVAILPDNQILPFKSLLDLEGLLA